MLNPEQIERKLARLRQSLAAVDAQMEQLRAQRNAHIGAIETLEDVISGREANPGQEEAPAELSEDELKTALGADELEVVPLNNEHGPARTRTRTGR